jgi:ferritin-like metal-binding protein YciE
MPMNNLKDLYVEQLQDLYSAENQILKALPDMEKRAQHDELKSAFREHRQVTEEQVRRLDQIFDDLGAKAGGHHCQGMEGLIKEGKEMIEEDGDSDVIDAGLIAAAQRVEHYEIAGYGTVRTYAQRLGRENDVDLLQRTLDEEGETDKRLTRIAEKVVNRDAMR